MGDSLKRPQKMFRRNRYHESNGAQSRDPRFVDWD